MSAPHAVVVGGGLAGLSAALDLATGGVAVTLLESRPRLGGRTFSFDRDGVTVDNGQHVHLRCCTAYRGLLDRLGVAHLAPVRRLDVPVRGTDGRWSRLRRGRLPAPLHLAPALARYRALRPAERLRAVTAARALGRVDVTAPDVDATAYAGWLAAHRQSPSAIDALWGLLVTATLNLDPADASLAAAATVVQTGLLADRGAADLGWANVPLAALHAEPAARALAAAGAQVRLSCRVRAVLDDGFDAGEAQTVLTDDGPIEADAVVLAVPHDAVGPLLPADASLRTPHGAVVAVPALADLGTSPIFNLHVGYDRRVTGYQIAAAVGSPVQWVFDRTPTGVAGQHLTVSVSAADGLVDESVIGLRARFLPALAEMFPTARAARVAHVVAVRQRDATFRAAPGSAQLRPGAVTGRPGLLLAGAWTATGWPDTMEGAVRSGREAARGVQAYLQSRRPLSLVGGRA